MGGDRGGPGAPREGDLGGGMDYGLEAARSRTPMGQRPGEFSTDIVPDDLSHALGDVAPGGPGEGDLGGGIL